MNDETPTVPRLGEIGLTNFAPYLMNRIMGRYNASLRDEMAEQGLTTPKMRALAVLSVVDGPLIRELAVYTVVDPSTLSRSLDQLQVDGLIRRGILRGGGKRRRYQRQGHGNDRELHLENSCPKVSFNHVMKSRAAGNLAIRGNQASLRMLVGRSVGKLTMPHGGTL